MGLDIYHYKATTVKPLEITPFSENYFTEEIFEGFDVPFQYFEPYIQMIDIPKAIKTFIFIKEEASKDKFLNHSLKSFREYGHDIIFDKSTIVDEYMKEIQQKNEFSHLTLHKWDTSSWVGVELLDWASKLGFYYEEVGYQRKGMNKIFHERFYGEIDCFTSKSDFEFALSCVDYYWSNDTEEDVKWRKICFQQEFVDIYEEHRSWMLASY